MLKIVIWKWKIVIIWDFTRFHVSKNPSKKPKVQVPEPIPEEIQKIYTEAMEAADYRKLQAEEGIYPIKGE